MGRAACWAEICIQTSVSSKFREFFGHPEISVAVHATREALRGPLRANGQEKQKDGSDHFQLVMLLSQGSWRNKCSLSKQQCSRQCALVLRWLWMLSLEPAVQAA